MILINLGAGVALIMLGVRFLRKGLDRFLGGRFIDWLRRFTGNRFSSLFAGIITGALSASSTGISILTAQMLEAGSIRATSMLAVLLGGNIGITFLAHLVSFNLKDDSGIFLFLGTLGFLFFRNQKLRGISQCVLALGLIFLSMFFIGMGANQIGANRDMDMVLFILDNHPVFLGLIAAMLAVLMQSSTATIGLGIGLATSQVLHPSDMIPWILGTNIGLAMTSLIVCWGTLEGRRIGYANLLAKFGVAILLMVCFSTKILPTQINFLPINHVLPVEHTLFNVIVAAMALPFLHPLLAITKQWLVPDPEEASITGSQPGTFLDPQALNSPSIALAYATRESLRMVDDIRLGLQHLVLAKKTGNATLVKTVKHSGERIDNLNQNIMLYLGQLGEELSDYDRNWQLILLNFSNELKMAGDVIEKKLCDAITKQISELTTLTTDEVEMFDHLFASIIRHLDIAASLVSDRNLARATEYLAEKNQMDSLCLRTKQARFQDFRKTDKQSLSATLCFLDMIDALQRIDDHISSVASLIISEHRS